MKTKIITAALVMAMLTGCDSFGRKPQEEPVQPVIYNVVQRSIYKPQRPYPVNPLDLKFYVITEENLTDKMAEIRKDRDGEFTVIAMTPETYENLTINTANTTRFIQDVQDILDYYERIISEINAEKIITDQ